MACVHSTGREGKGRVSSDVGREETPALRLAGWGVAVAGPCDRTTLLLAGLCGRGSREWKWEGGSGNEAGGSRKWNREGGSGSREWVPGSGERGPCRAACLWEGPTPCVPAASCVPPPPHRVSLQCPVQPPRPPRPGWFLVRTCGRRASDRPNSLLHGKTSSVDQTEFPNVLNSRKDFASHKPGRLC